MAELEVEVKIKVNIEETAHKLEELGFSKGSTVFEKDTYFNGKQVDLRVSDRALRIRERRNEETGQLRYVLNYKGPKVDNITMAREETQFDIPNYEQGQTLLEGLGYLPVAGVEKTRIHYCRDEITCCLDRVTGLGEFLEVEIMTEEKMHDEAVEAIAELLEILGLKMEDTIRNSYLSMLEEGSEE